MKRQRGRGRKPGGHHHHQPNRTLESSGPDLKVRGPAAHIYEKYQQLARDAAMSGDRVMAENYLQHAEHYYRMLRAMQPAPAPTPLNERFGGDGEFEGEGENGAEGEAPGAEGEVAADGAEQPEVEFPGAPQGQEYDRDGGFRRRRGRRNRFRPGDGEREGGPEGAAPREGQGEREGRGPPRDGQGEREGRGAPREGEREGRGRERGERGAREGAERGGEEGEGFSGGPRPAFLGSD